jgi:hypothetical protein
MSTGLATNTGFYVKPKQQAEFKNKWVGPIQMCNLGFRLGQFLGHRPKDFRNGLNFLNL